MKCGMRKVLFLMVCSTIVLCSLSEQWGNEKLIQTRKLLMKESIFREYDIRGIVDDEFIIDQVYDLTRAIICYFIRQKPSLKTIAVGMDGRTHSPAIMKEICRACVDSGLNVIDVGLCPIPVLYFALHTMPVDGGLMITASHNPKEYNGIKICLGKDVVSGTQIKEIKHLYEKKGQTTLAVKGILTRASVIPRYVDWLVDHFRPLIGMNMRFVIDCGNGAAGAVVPQLIKKMRWNNVQLLYEKICGSFPHHEADPTKIENMRDVCNILKTTDAQVGIGFDGDADRMGVVTKEGAIVLGDRLLALFAEPVVKKYPGSSIVFNVMSSSGLIELLKQWGAHGHMVPVGRSVMVQEMNRLGALIGGETSCHFFFKDRHFGYDDGIYAGLRFLEILYLSNRLLTDLLTMLPCKVTSPEFRIVSTESKKNSIVESVKKAFVARPDVTTITIDGVRVQTSYGWGIVRASNTQPVLSLRFEANSSDALKQIKQEFISILSNHFNVTQLKKQLQV